MSTIFLTKNFFKNLINYTIQLNICLRGSIKIYICPISKKIRLKIILFYYVL